MYRYKSNLGKRLIGLLLCILFVLQMGMCLSTTANAAAVNSILAIPSTSATTAASIAAKAGKAGSKAILTYSTSTSGGIWSFNNTKYHALDTEVKRTFMEKLLSTITKSGLNEQMRNKAYNFIASQDTAITNSLKYLQTDANADFVEAKKWFDPFSGVVGTILGVLCVLIFIFTALSTAVDIFYLALPGFRVIVEGGNEKKKPLLISREAYSSYCDSVSAGSYKSPYALYLKRRVWVMILVAICIGYLISGKIYDIVSYVIDAFTL